MHRAARVVLLFLGLGTLAALTACSDLRVAPYRDPQLLANYRYALGERYAEVQGLRLCYQEAGSGPTVVILPGLGTSIDFWQGNIPVLAKRFHVLAIDPPGFGKSDKPDASYDLDWVNQHILAFLDARGVQRFSVIGGSMGGHLGLLLALEQPERVERLVMMGATGGWAPPGPLMRMVLALWNEWIVTDYTRGNWPHIFDAMFKHRGELPANLFRYQMAVRADGPRYAAEGRAIARAIRSIFFHSCRARLGELRTPLLLIWGAEDELHPPDSAVVFRDAVADSRLVVIPDAGHEVMIDQAAEFNETVGAFLAGGTAGVEDRPMRPSAENGRRAVAAGP